MITNILFKKEMVKGYFENFSAAENPRSLTIKLTVDSSLGETNSVTVDTKGE